MAGDRTAGEGDVVVVTGGAGFLGSHLVPLLRERAEHVTEVRVLDLAPYTPQEEEEEADERKERVPVRSVIGDITDLNTVRAAVRGAHSVIHLVSVIDVRSFPNFAAMEKVNVEGTRTVLEACTLESVERLVYCSTIDVVIGHEDIIDGTEDTTHTPPTFIFPGKGGYPDSKHRAEELVLAANGQTLPNGKVFKTAALRPPVLFGDGDPQFVVTGLRSAKYSGGKLYPVGDPKARFQAAYVGNVAWAFICADRELRRSETAAGQAYFVPDDTPVTSLTNFLAPYLEGRGYKVAERRLPFFLVYWAVRLLELLLWIISPLVKVNLSTSSHSIRYVNMKLGFSRARAERMLEFKPLYTPEEAQERSLRYYNQLEL